MDYCLDSAVECVEKWNERTKRIKGEQNDSLANDRQ